MNGHQPLIELRRRRLTTPAVFVTDGAVEFNLDRNWTHPVWGSDFAHVRIDEADIPEALDLRFAVGLNVHLDGRRGEARAQRLHHAFIAADARAIATFCYPQLWSYARG